MSDLVWLDLETTGLNPSSDTILEVAVCRASLSDPFNAQVILNEAIWFHPDLVKKQDPFIIDMHTKNGLFAACADETKAKDLFEVEDVLLKAFPLVTVKDDMPKLAGSSVHFDDSFIKAHMPRFAKRLSHRHYDVSALKLECESQGMPRFQKAEAHRALDDIYESITHAKECRAWLRGLR